MSAVERARRLIADELTLDPVDVRANHLAAEVVGWDSLAHVRITLRLEEERGSSLSTEQVLSIRGVADVARLLVT
jgi:acyl carrier protein